MDKQAFAYSIVSLSDEALRMLLSLLEKASVIELLAGKISHTLEREMARVSGWSRNELVFKTLIRFNEMIHNRSVSYSNRDELTSNGQEITAAALETVKRIDKEFVGETLLDLFVYEGEKIEEIRHLNPDIPSELVPLPRVVAVYVQELVEKQGGLPTLSNQRLREKLLPFLIYCLFLWDEKVGEEDADERLLSFLQYWQEKRGVYDHLRAKYDEHAYAVELEERLLEQKTSNMKVLQKQLDQIVEEKDNIRETLSQRFPYDVHKMHGIFEGKAGVMLQRMHELMDRRAESVATEAGEGLLRSLWHKIDTSISEAQIEREIKRLSVKMIDEMTGLKQDITRLPVYYMDRVKQIHDCDTKIQEIRRWRYQLEQETEAHKDTIQHHMAHRATLEQQIKQWEKEWLFV